MVLRKYIENSMLIDIKQTENDRVIEFICTVRDDHGYYKHYHYISENMGRHRNILLVNKDENKLYEAIRHIPPSMNSYRTLLPGAEYRPAPEQDNINPFDFSDRLEISGTNTKERIKSIQSTFQGFGRDSAKELLHQIDKNEHLNQTEIFHRFLKPYVENQYQPTLTEEGNRASFTALPYSSIKGEKEQFETLYELLDEYYENRAEKDRVHQQTNDLSQILNNERKKNVKKLDKLNREDKAADDAEVYRTTGAVLAALMLQAEQGMAEIELEDLYDINEPIRIEVDQHQAPVENA